jgi:hypothetical protein
LPLLGWRQVLAGEEWIAIVGLAYSTGDAIAGFPGERGAATCGCWWLRWGLCLVEWAESGIARWKLVSGAKKVA